MSNIVFDPTKYNMKLKKTAAVFHHGSLMSMKQMMMLSLLVLQVDIHGVQGQIDCGFANGDANVCFTGTNTFLCNQNGDLCSSNSFDKIKGVTSECSGRSDPGPGNEICSDSSFGFDNDDTESQGMTCDGLLACDGSNIFFGEKAKEGTLLCNGWASCHFANVFFSIRYF